MNPIHQDKPEETIWFVVHNGDPSGEECAVGELDPKYELNSGYDNIEIFHDNDDFQARLKEIGKVYPPQDEYDQEDPNENL